MRFRFGWRKEQKNEKLIHEALHEDYQVDLPEDPVPAGIDPIQASISNDTPLQNDAVTPRIIVFGDHDETGSLYTLFLRFKGYEVLHFPSPTTCALVTGETCNCPRDHVCADLFLIDMEMEEMTGLELIRQQRDNGCRAWPWNKAIISNGFTYRQEQEARVLGCMSLRKPFRLRDLLGWINAVEKTIPLDRKLTPFNELHAPAKY